MRIGIDARMYNEGLGIGRYVAKLIAHLETIDTPHEYVIFLTKKNWDAYQPRNSRFHKVCAPIQWYTLSEQIVMPLLLLAQRLDLVHFPHINVPIVYPKRYVMTVHDLILIKHPLSATSAASTRNSFIHGIKLGCYRFVLKRALARAAAIITVSQSVKTDLQHYCGIAEDDIHVVYEGVDALGDPASCPLGSRFSEKTYFFRAGNAYPHKNVEGLLRAFALVRDRFPDVLLVLCGQDDFFRKRCIEQIAQMGLATSVTHLGPVSDACLAWFYRHAVAYVFPSFEEGFGLPALEAAMNGCPVLASRIPVLEEICGDVALYFDPNDPSHLARVMETIMNDTTLRDTLIHKGYTRATMFSWDTLAKETARVYAECCRKQS